MWGRKQREIDRLRRRVQELEERLCPTESHEWVRTGREPIFIGSSVEFVYEYSCKNCGKKKIDMI